MNECPGAPKGVGGHGFRKQDDGIWHCIWCPLTRTDEEAREHGKRG
jgi:hypothetical protein